MEKFEKKGMKYDYVKVLLYAYPQLENLRAAVAASAENKALLSFRVFDPVRAAEKIAHEVGVGEALGEVGKAMEECLAVLSEEEKYLLEYKYFRRKKSGYRACEIVCSERSYYRKQNFLCGKIAGLLAARGWTEERFFAEFGKCGFMMRALRVVAQGKERALVRKRGQRTLELRRVKSPNRSPV